MVEGVIYASLQGWDKPQPLLWTMELSPPPAPPGIHTLPYLERLVKAAKSSARAAMNNAKSISIGPLEVADKPKTTTTMMSNIPKMAHATISGRGCFVQFILFLILSFVWRLEISLSLKTCFLLLARGPNSILPVYLYHPDSNSYLNYSNAHARKTVPYREAARNNTGKL